jgi:hypothetical protein
VHNSGTYQNIYDDSSGACVQQVVVIDLQLMKHLLKIHYLTPATNVIQCREAWCEKN